MNLLEHKQIVDIIIDAENEIKTGFKAKEGGWKLWSACGFHPLVDNCLPASFSAVNNEKLRAIYPNSYLVVGYTKSKFGSKKTYKLKKNKIREFLTLKSYSNLDTKPVFHAWIALNETEYLDITGPIYIENTKPSDHKYYYANKLAKEFEDHIPVLTRQDAVNFFEKLSEGQENGWSGNSLLDFKRTIFL